MSKKKILVVEDDHDISELIQYNLDQDGYEVSAIYTGSSAVETAEKILPDLIILDLMLPELDGIEVFRFLKQSDITRDIPIIMLTAKGEESDVLVGLQLGADDYVTKPFSPKILLARVKTVLRRVSIGKTSDSLAKDVRVFGDLKIDLIKHKVKYNGNLIELTSLEFNILEFLSRSPGRAYNRDQILDGVWKEGKYIVDRAVDVHIRGLRKKLGDAADFVETVRGIGYRFKEMED